LPGIFSNKYAGFSLRFSLIIPTYILHLPVSS
jgi:hypothetical protein